MAKLETSMSNVGSAGGAAPITALPSAPNNRTASRSTSSPFTAAAAAESLRGRVLSARGRVRCRLSSTCWSAAESCSTRAMAAPSESTVWTAVVSRTAGSTAPACDPAAPPHAATPTTRTASVAVPSPRCSVVIPPLSRREKIAENAVRRVQDRKSRAPWRSEEHTSELQSRGHLVCRLLLEKKKKKKKQRKHEKTKHKTIV